MLKNGSYYYDDLLSHSYTSSTVLIALYELSQLIHATTQWASTIIILSHCVDKK